MQVALDALRHDGLPSRSVVTIGNYDGIHRGQRAVLSRVVDSARAAGLPAVLVTFEPHPLRILAPAQAPAALLTREQKLQGLEALGLDWVAMIAFTTEFAATRAETFVRSFLVGRLGVEELWVGRRFAFGRGREGDLELLTRLGEELGFRVHGIEEELFEGQPISSTRIRRALGVGNVEEARELLGRRYSLTGEVVAGERLGRRLGWPTLNLAPDGQLLPCMGVYATQVEFLDGPDRNRRFDAVTNIGRRPTVPGDRPPTVESHLLDFDRSAYGERIELIFHRRLRDEMLFPGIEALSEQIGRDVERAREYFGGLGCSDEDRSSAAEAD